MTKDNSANDTPSLNNYQKLNANRGEVLDYAHTVSQADVSVISPGDKSQMLSSAKEALQEENFSKAIKKLDQLKDAKIGISWHESQDLTHGTKSLVRDARNADIEASRHDAEEKYAMQVLNEIRAGIDLLNTDAFKGTEQEKEKAKEKLKETASLALESINSEEQNPDSLSAKNIKEYNTYIVHALEEAGIEDAAQKLNFAKEVSNFKDDHRHITTLTTAKGKDGTEHTVIESEVMLNGLTDKQQKMYQHIADSKDNPDKKPPEGVTRNDMLWYDKMPEYKKELMQEVAGEVAKGNKIIPTQLLSDAVGIRNGYQKVTAIESKGDKEPQILGTQMHSGAPATKIKFNDQANLTKEQQKQFQSQIVQDNIEQLRSYNVPGQKLNLHNLTSKTPLDARGEGFIANQLKEAKSALNNDKSGKSKKSVIGVVASPINKWRAFGGGRDQKEFNDILKNVAKDLESANISDDNKQKLEVVATYLKEDSHSKSRRNSATEAISNLKGTELEKLAPILKEAVEAKHAIKSGSVFTHSQNINLEIASKMGVIRNQIDQIDQNSSSIRFENTKKSMPRSVDFCKSGKDRTGLLELEKTHRLVSNHLGIDPESKTARGNKLNQAAGGHTQEMAGVQGGTTGCHSIKTNPEFSLNKSDRQLEGIVNQKSSSFNSKIKIVEEKQIPAVVAKFDNKIAKNEGAESELNPNQKTNVQKKNTSAKLAGKVKENRGKMAAMAASPVLGTLAVGISTIAAKTSVINKAKDMGASLKGHISSSKTSLNKSVKKSKDKGHQI